jgi:hypothetical protein
VKTGQLQRLALAAAALAYTALFAATYPPMYLASDEAGNLALAGVLRQGTPFADAAGRQLPAPVPARDGHRTSRYPPGLAALLAPLTLAGPGAAFLLPLAVHLAIFFLLAWLLARAGLAPLWAVLYLCHPTAVLHSRTLMSNLPAAAVLLGAFALLVRGGALPALAAGLLLGFGTLVRQPLVLAGAALALGAAWRGRRALLAGSWAERLRGAPALFVFGLVPGLAAYAIYHWWVFGSPLASGYAEVGAGRLFGAAVLAHNLPRYALILLAVYPLMLVAPAFYRGPWQAEVVLLPAGCLLFYGAYGWFDAGASLPETAMRAPRFLLPALPFFVIAYAGMLAAPLRRVPGLELAALGLAAVLGLGGAVAVSAGHGRAQAQQAADRDGLYAATAEGAVLVCSIETAELLQDDWGRREAVDYAEVDWDRLADLAASGRPVFLVNAGKGPGSLRAWGEVLRAKAAECFELRPVHPAGGGRLRIWRLEPAARAEPGP